MLKGCCPTDSVPSSSFPSATGGNGFFLGPLPIDVLLTLSFSISNCLPQTSYLCPVALLNTLFQDRGWRGVGAMEGDCDGEVKRLWEVIKDL